MLESRDPAGRPPRSIAVLFWYAVNGVQYLGPFESRQAAVVAATARFSDLGGKRQGTVELLDPLSPIPTWGLLGPLAPRY